MSFIHNFKNKWHTKEVGDATKLLGLGVLIGVIIFLITARDPNDFKNFITNAFADILPALDEDFLTIFISIFQNNLIASFITIFLGLIHRFLSKGILFLNGCFLGFIITGLIFFGSGQALFYLIPHGIFEIPALIFATTLGISLTTTSKSFKGRFLVLIDSKQDLILIIVLLLIAAFIESLLIFLIR